MYYIIVLYIILSIIIYIAIQKYDQQSARNVKVILFNLLFVLLTLIMGLRGLSVGVDTINYLKIFNNIANTPLERLICNFFYDDLEIGFVIYTKIIACIWNNYQFFLLVSAFIFCWSFKRFIRHTTHDFFIASIIFTSIGIYLGAFNILRQMLAVAILSNAWIYLEKRKYLLTILFSLIALTFHFSSIIFTTVYVLYVIRNRLSLVRIFPIILVIFYFFFETILQDIAPFLGHYGNYMSNHKTVQEANSVIILWLIESLISVFFIYKSRLPSKFRFVGCAVLLYVLMNIIGLRFNYVERLGMYFSPFLIPLFCYLSDYIKNRTIKDLAFLLMNSCFLIYFLISSNTEQYKYTSIILSF